MKILQHHWWLLAAFFIVAPGHARTFEVRPAVVDREEEFEILANQLQPGDELILHGGTYSQSGRRAVHRLTGIALDNDRVCDGGVPASAFVDSQQLDFRPGPSSPLQGRAEPAWAPDHDFDGLQRHPPFNVGAYESDERSQHPGWRIQPGFKK